MVGFALDTGDSTIFAQSLQPLIDSCEKVTIDRRNELCIVRDRSGAEIWIALRPQKSVTSIVTVNPAFSGEGRTPVEIVAIVPSKDKDYSRVEVTISARFAGEETPLVFDLADPRQATALKPHAKVAIDIAAFSFAPVIYDDAAAYYEAQKKPDVKVQFAADFFIPTGMFTTAMGGKADDGGPTGHADFAGTVLKAERRHNDNGGGDFWWALVKTYAGATIDVVLDGRTVPRDIKVGNIVTGSFWLSAHVSSSSSSAAPRGTAAGELRP
jgi:hypothetical protein